MTSMGQIFKPPSPPSPPTPLSIYVRNSSISLTLDAQFYTNPLSKSSNDTVHVNEQDQNKTKSHHIQIHQAFYYSI